MFLLLFKCLIFLFFILFFFATAEAYESSQARDRIHATAATQAVAVTMPDP